MKTTIISAKNEAGEFQEYRAQLSEDSTVRISRRMDSGAWEWAGDGKWENGTISDCAADLGDEAYEKLDEALQAELECA